MEHRAILNALGFHPEESANQIYTKDIFGYCIAVDLKKQFIDYGNIIKAESATTQNFSQAENWVVLECVCRLLACGYKPQNIILEKTWPAGHGTSGRLDICVTRDDGSEYLLIECKTLGKEFDKALNRMKKDGGQLFTYFKFSNKADVLMLYASEFKKGTVTYRNEIIKVEGDYRAGDVKDFYEKWNKLTKDNGVFDAWVKPYNFESKALTINDLEDIRAEDSSFIFNRFLEILRHNVVSDKGNAFNRIFTLFLCKIYDEKINEATDNELGFQWLDGVDDHRSFQLRLTDLYKNGMHEFLEKVVTDFSETEFKNRFPSLSEELRTPILEEFRKIRLEKNNEFAIKDVYDEQSFNENALVVKEIVELLQGYKLRYTKKQQYLSDFFELLLTTGLKQESGQFFTPVPVAQFVIKSLPIDTLIEQKLANAKIDNDTLLPYVMDYAAGSGHFITETMHEFHRLIYKKDDKKYAPSIAKKIRNWKDDHFSWAIDYVYGIEKDYRLVKVGKVGCYLHGDGLANVIHSDGLASFGHPDYKGKLRTKDKDFPQENKQFDIIVSNPPYSVSAFKNASRQFYKSDDFELYDSLTDNSSEIECLFIERTKQLLKDGGVAGIILPSSILSNGGIYAKSRELILQYFDIIGITELGSNTFMATGTNTVVLFLKRRNNYISIHLKIAVEKFFSVMQDVTLNGIETPVSKYVAHVWQGLTFDDYTSLIKGEPNSKVAEHEIYKDYRKKIKVKNAKDDQQFWTQVIAIEQEKLYYFVLAYPQKVVLVKSGEKDAEKRFLGYEFSNRRGSEGIHPIQRSKTIEECTQLFDADVFDNPKKASTYIYKAFQGDFDCIIDESMQSNISRDRLVDMLTFDRVEFEKNILLSAKKKVRYELIWGIENLFNLSELADIRKGTSITKEKTLDGNVPVIAGGQDIAYFHNISNRDGNVVTVSASGAYAGFVNYFITPIFASDCNTISSKDENNISTKLIYLFLKTIQSEIYQLQRGQAQPHVYSEDLSTVKIPLPALEIQQKIVADIELLETQEITAKKAIEAQKQNIKSIVSKISAKPVALSGITSKIGSGATPRGGEGSYQQSGIPLIRSQNVHDNHFYDQGLAFINNAQADKLKNVIVEKGDVLFNITGASIARCCIAPETYLPARVNQHVAIIRVTEKALPKFVQTILVSDVYKSQLLGIGNGATSREAITKQQLEDFKIPLPSIEEQQKIVAKIEQIEKQIAQLEIQIDEIPKQKEAVLRKYL